MGTCSSYLHAATSHGHAGAVRGTGTLARWAGRCGGGLGMLGAAVVAASLLLSAPAIAQDGGCGTVSSEAFDMRRLDARGRNALRNVEKFHFPMHVETLTRGESGLIGADIGFVLNYIPNHYRALDAMARLGVKEKSAKPKGATYSIACYFDRAIRFVPDDGQVRMIQGMYLAKLGKLDDALAQYQEAEKMMPDSLNVAYNLGLLHFEMKKYDQSLEYAKKAYGGGITLPGLKNKLSGAGKWPANLVIVPKPPRAAKAAEPPVADDASKTAQESASPKTAQEAPAKAGEATPAPR